MNADRRVPCAQHATDHKHRGTPAQNGSLRSQRLTQRATGRSQIATLPQLGDRRRVRGPLGRDMRAGNLNPAIGHRAYPYPGMPLDFLQGVGPSCEREILAYLPPPLLECNAERRLPGPSPEVPGSARVSRPRRNAGPHSQHSESFGRRSGSVGDRPQQAAAAWATGAAAPAQSTVRSGFRLRRHTANPHAAPAATRASVPGSGTLTTSCSEVGVDCSESA